MSSSSVHQALLVAIVALLVGARAVAAQPGSGSGTVGSGSASTGSATAAGPTAEATGSAAGSGSAAMPTAGSAAPSGVLPTTGSAAPSGVMPTTTSPAAGPEAQKACREAMAKDPTYVTLVGSCLDAMNADRNFAASLATTGDQIAAETRDRALLKQHTDGAAEVAKNQKHVILAYAAMWILSILFVIFLWRKQATLKGEIQLLKRDLEAATKK